MGGAQLTDRSLSPAGAADGATFTFNFIPPMPGSDDFGVDHFINFVFGDYDVTPAQLLVDGVIVPLIPQANPAADGLVQTAFAVVPWANMLDGQVVGSSRVDLQACKLEYSIVSPK